MTSIKSRAKIIIIITVGFMIFDFVESGEETTVKQAQQEVVLCGPDGYSAQKGMYIDQETGNEKVITAEEADTIENALRVKCKETLKELKLYGDHLIHDVLEISSRETSENTENNNGFTTITGKLVNGTLIANQTAFERAAVYMTRHRYKVYAKHLLIRVISTNTNIVEYFCDNIDPLLRMKFTGHLECDLKNVNNRIGILENDKLAYVNYLKDPETNKEYTEMKLHAVTPINMLYHYSMKNSWINDPVGDLEKTCKKNLEDAGYTGTLENQITITSNRELTEHNTEYDNFVEYLREKEVLQTDKNLVKIYCDIEVALGSEGFIGKKTEDLNHESGNAEKKDLIYGYKFFLNLPINKNSQVDLRRKYALFRIVLD